jgi:S-DNA-T family DNA segregation ATPase FtsK/SpoIIIE
MAFLSGSLGGNGGGRRGAASGGTAEFVRRRLAELAGFVLVIAALALTAALASFDKGDPSWNNAVDAPAHNLLGRFGAEIADLLLQTLGLSAGLLPVVLLAWSFRLLAGRGVAAFWMRLSLVPPTLLLASFALSLLGQPWFWPLGRVGVGGFIGDTLRRLLE